jgi:hypothetical protein
MGKCGYASRIVAAAKFLFFLLSMKRVIFQANWWWSRRFPSGDVDHRKLDAADVGAGHCHLFHCVGHDQRLRWRMKLSLRSFSTIRHLFSLRSSSILVAVVSKMSFLFPWGA